MSLNLQKPDVAMVTKEYRIKSYFQVRGFLWGYGAGAISVILVAFHR